MSKRLTSLIVGMLTVLLLASAVWSGRFVLWLLGGAALGWLMMGLMIWAVMVKPIRINRHAPALFPSGINVQLEIELQLQGMLPMSWVIIEDAWHRKLFIASARGVVVYRYTTPVLSRGIYSSEGVKVTYGDMLGFGRRQFVWAESLQLAVYPTPSTEAALSTAWGREEAWPDYRRYREGDPLHLLNWKLSAQRDEWIVREQVAPAAKRPLVILLDRYSNEEEWEHSLRIASGWLLQGQPIVDGWLGVPVERETFRWYAVDDEQMKLAALRELAGGTRGNDPDESSRGMAEAMQRWPLAAYGVIHAGEIRMRRVVERGQDDAWRFR